MGARGPTEPPGGAKPDEPKRRHPWGAGFTDEEHESSDEYDDSVNASGQRFDRFGWSKGFSKIMGYNGDTDAPGPSSLPSGPVPAFLRRQCDEGLV